MTILNEEGHLRTQTAKIWTPSLSDDCTRALLITRALLMWNSIVFFGVGVTQVSLLLKASSSNSQS